jgi:hypothetical protein
MQGSISCPMILKASMESVVMEEEQKKLYFMIIFP